MRGIGAALYDYHEKHGSFPPTYSVDKNGHRLHSWRVLILPFLEGGEELAEQIRLDEPWDSPHNLQFHDQMPKLFQCPGFSHHHWWDFLGLTDDKADLSLTTYVPISAEGSIFQVSEPVRIMQIADGTSNTLMVVEVGRQDAVNWMKPDAGISEADLLSHFQATDPQEKTTHHGGIHVLLGDGSVRFFQSEITPQKLHGDITYDGKDFGSLRQEVDY